MANEILRLANDRVAVVINDDFSGIFSDRARGVDWPMSPCCYQEIGSLSDMAIWNRVPRCYMDRYPSFFRARRLDDGRLEVAVLDPLGEVRGKLVCAIQLDDQWITLAIEHIDDALPSLIFPPYLESESLVIPNAIGKWYRTSATPSAIESQFLMPACGWNMRWFGGLRGDNGWIAIVEDGYADAGVYLCQLTACAGWQKTLGRWNRRSMRIGFADNGYVGLARTYRSYAQANGLYRSLREKIAQRPVVENLIGGRCVSFFQAHTVHSLNSRLWMTSPTEEDIRQDGTVKVHMTHGDVATIIEEAKQAGMRKGYFNIRGWLNGGYDERHPDVWPPEPALGSVDEFRAVTTQNDPYVTLLHDNYQDMYQQAPSFPQWVMRTPDGRPKAGGTWHGGRCYVVNSEKSIEYVRRNWEHLKTLNLRGTFLDTIGGAHFQEDYSPDHQMTRTQDAEAKLEIARFYAKQGMLVGTEYGSDFSVPDADFIETRYAVTPGQTPPLWLLVYHDAVVTLRYHSGTNDFEAARDMEDILWGCSKLWPAGDLASWRARKDAFKASLHVDEWHARVGLDDMVNHRYLDEDGTVEQTEFSSGVSVIGNFGSEPFSSGKTTVQPGGYAILD